MARKCYNIYRKRERQRFLQELYKPLKKSFERRLNKKSPEMAGEI